MTATLETGAQGLVEDQRRLFRLNRRLPNAEEYGWMRATEDAWLGRLAAEHAAAAPGFGSLAELVKALGALHASEQADVPPSQDYLALSATMEEFRTVVAQFAVDGLIESQPLLPVVPRLPYRSGMAVFRVLIDELGCGNEDQAHSQLYRDLLTELGMSLELDDYVDDTGAANLAYVNLFHWLAARAESPEYFLGAYAYFEASVLYGFQGFAQAAKRLGIQHHQYFTEHLYIDQYHSRQMRSAIRAYDEELGADLSKVWAGVTLTSAVVGEANEAAIALARARSGAAA
ncbi:iron-containing redox enzyme family protein [Kitasatospora sp. NPDC094015]|uniref:iron-containing redox enzyme family protein n=1 Tax=Kitasatospora sp. NPDC094015 TaxID=3155205 RepID=UPI003331C09C